MVSIASTSIYAMRNMLLLFNLVGTIDADTLKKFTEPLPEAIQVESLRDRSPGL